MRTLSPFVLLAAACAAPATHDTAGEPTPDDDTGGYVAPPPALDAAGVQAAVEEVFAIGLPDAVVTLTSYLDLMAAGDETCPGDATQLTGDVPVEGCESEGGHFYIGVSAWQHEETAGEAGPRLTTALDGDFEIRTPAGATFEAGGRVARSRDGVVGDWNGSTRVQGTWGMEGAPGPLGAGVSGAITLLATDRPELQRLVLEGPVAVGTAAVTFTSFTVDLLQCEGRPVGSLRVRDPNGYWYTVTLADDCSGCGEAAYYDGTVVGEVCLSLLDEARTAIDHVGGWE